MQRDPQAAVGRRRFLVGSLALLALPFNPFAGIGGFSSAQAYPDPPPLDRPERWDFPPLPEAIQGRVIDAETGGPIAGASVHSGTLEIRTDGSGRFSVATPTLPLIVKAPGYERYVASVNARDPTLTVSLAPRLIKTAYLTYYGVGHGGIRTRVFALLDDTELNGVVIDVKGDRGWVPYETQVPLAVQAGARGPVIIEEFDEMLAELRAKRIYTIARIVVFKDHVLARHRPKWAVLDRRTGRLWHDNEGLAWVDPFREEVWDYVLAIAREAAEKGFDEIQFDYLRFPSDGRISAARYSQPNKRATRLAAIAGFLARAREELAPTGVFLSADIFGYTAFNTNDTDIGQRIEEMAPHVDYLSPMVYPSAYHRGIPGYRNPVEHPYAIVFETIKQIRQRTATLPVKVRPWLQDFRDYAFDRREFGVVEILAQTRAATEAGAVGWMLWNPRNSYTEEALQSIYPPEMPFFP